MVSRISLATSGWDQSLVSVAQPLKRARGEKQTACVRRSMSSPSLPRDFAGGPEDAGETGVSDGGDVFVEIVVVVVDDEREGRSACIRAAHLTEGALVAVVIQIVNRAFDLEAEGLAELFAVVAAGEGGLVGPEPLVVAVDFVDFEAGDADVDAGFGEVVGEDSAGFLHGVVGDDAVPHEVRAGVGEEIFVEIGVGFDVGVEPEVDVDALGGHVGEEFWGRGSGICPIRRSRGRRRIASRVRGRGCRGGIFCF